ncbi:MULTISPECIES: hypothetical protein [unclassified Bacteroides]|jgi:hypothetical protein|uniref:hypothetical protein n=1 Tax=unclassified Bacteroides TaxID=2646097 RepID=UPI000E9007CE|nr:MULTISPECIES: hypothetical protein [unclassified Bacteroides]RGN50086.1 hypothetical protein DXB63_05900 [Bacteroides sp. OM05-12]RHR75244.1 hypothetical protein DWW69_10990 [Bacteroides sp. AF16-49]DAU20763.1 MAG TPA: hypothetical protein [Caudoviricetes sp.]
MKVKVISVFRDKFTGQLYNPGEVLEIEDEARIEDLVSRKLAERIVVPEEKNEVKISLFEKEFDKKELVEALKSIGEKGAMNMKEETLLANVTALDEEKTLALKKALGIEV